MDTRSKILSAAAAIDNTRRLRENGRPVIAVTGYFDVLLAGDVQELRSVAARTPGASILAILLPAPDPVLSSRARAEMAAALDMIDYVVTIADEEAFLAAAEPAEVVRLEAGQRSRMRQLVQHVHWRHEKSYER